MTASASTHGDNYEIVLVSYYDVKDICQKYYSFQSSLNRVARVYLKGTRFLGAVREITRTVTLHLAILIRMCLPCINEL